MDCITQPRYKAIELAMLHTALSKLDRPIALSLSPGEPPIEYGEEFAANAEQWRISNDVWDIWRGEKAYPQGVSDRLRGRPIGCERRSRDTGWTLTCFRSDR